MPESKGDYSLSPPLLKEQPSLQAPILMTWGGSFSCPCCLWLCHFWVLLYTEPASAFPSASPAAAAWDASWQAPGQPHAFISVAD